MPSPPLLAGRYRLESQIAAGGVGEVWRAEDTVLTRPVAVKLLRAEFAGHAEMQERFRAEARHAGALSHPAIARVYDYCEPAPEHPAFLVMELVDGPSLAAVLTAGPLGAAQTLDVVAQVASGLQTAHASALVHRDIKPANLLLDADGQVKITDFGIAHVAGSVPVTRTGTVMGTPAYLAPERVSGASATPASDLYSLGVVAYECLAGAQPFTGKPLEVAAAHRDLPLPPFPHAVPAEVAQLVAELTVKNPAARPASAQEVATRAARLREGMTGGAGGAADWLYHVPDTVADVPAPAPAPRLNPTLRWKTGRPGPAGQTQQARRARHHQDAGRAPQEQRPPHGQRPPQARRTRRRWQIAAAGSVAVAVVAATALVALALTPKPTPTRVAAGPTSPATQQPAAPSSPVTQSPSPAPSTPAAPAAVEVMAASLVGEPVTQVRQQLQLLGLSVRVRRHLSHKETGTVLAVQPNGKVRPSSTIVVTVAFMLAQDNNPDHHHHHGDGGGGQGFPGAATVASVAARPSGG
jgi:eukaryotic-like serine/threonine-protein kinase